MYLEYDNKMNKQYSKAKLEVKGNWSFVFCKVIFGEF